MRSVLLCLWLATILMVSITDGAGTAADKIKLAVSNVMQDSVDAPVTVDIGQVPDWLDGSFIRQSCAAFGEYGSDYEGTVNFINHLFDCIEMGTSFRFEDGKATFYNRYYNTTKTEIWKNYNMNMNDSKAFFNTALAPFDVEARNRLSNNYSQPGRLGGVEHVSWWQMGDKVAAWGESVNGVLMDVHNVEAIENYPFKDLNLGYPLGTPFTNNPAHNQKEPVGGKVWSTTMVFPEASEPRYRLPRIALYSVEDDFRTVVSEVPFTTVDAALCWYVEEGSPYPDMTARPGYMHSFAMTENYIVLPATSWLFDPCAFFRYLGTPDEPFFRSQYQYYSWYPSYLYVIRKEDGELIASIPTKAFFVTHQLNSYEENGLMHLDMLTYDDPSLYLDHTTLDAILDAEDAYKTYVERFTVNMSDWSLVERKELRKVSPDAIEMSNINPQYITKPYTYAYMGRNIWSSQINEVIKLNVETQEELTYVLPEGMFMQEPTFVPRPDSKAEDDGVILVQGTDGNKAKGFLLILDAQTMQPEAQVTAPDLALFGLHNAYFPSNIGRRPEPELYNAATQRTPTTHILFFLSAAMAMLLAM